MNIELYIHYSFFLSNQSQSFSQSFSQSNPFSLFSQSSHSITQKYINPPFSSSQRLNPSRKCQASISLSSKLNDQDKRNQYHDTKDTNEINREYCEWIMKILNRLTNMINDHSTQISSMSHKIDTLIRQTAEYSDQTVKHSTQLSSIVPRMDSLM